MARLACVSIPSIALQLLLNREPSWRGEPAVVVSEDKPLGSILAVTKEARRGGVEPGMRYATALTLVPDIRADVVTPQEIAVGVELIADRLYKFSPEIEVRSEEPGIFWVGAVGLDTLFVSLESWADAVQRDMQKVGFFACVVVGFSRFGSYAASKKVHRNTIFASLQDEGTAALSASLETLLLDVTLRERLSGLGVKTVEGFLKLPRGGVRKRFGPEAETFHRFASGELSLPVQSATPLEALVLIQAIPHLETEQRRLLIHFEVMIDRLLEDVRGRGELVTALQFTLILEDGSRQEEELKTAEPTRRRSLLLELLDLRLGALHLEGGVEKIMLAAKRIRARDEQLELFRRRPRRDLEAGARAFARIRAELGNDVIRRARLHDRHFPEKQYEWEPADRPSLASAMGDEGVLTLVRRILSEPVPLSPSFTVTQDPTRPIAPPGRTVGGPYVLSGEWWVQDQRRDYYFTEDSVVGRLRWLYYDRYRRRWFLQGFVD